MSSQRRGHALWAFPPHSLRRSSALCEWTFLVGLIASGCVLLHVSPSFWASRRSTIRSPPFRDALAPPSHPADDGSPGLDTHCRGSVLGFTPIPRPVPTLRYDLCVALRPDVAVGLLPYDYETAPIPGSFDRAGAADAFLSPTCTAQGAPGGLQCSRRPHVHRLGCFSVTAGEWSTRRRSSSCTATFQQRLRCRQRSNAASTTTGECEHLPHP